MDSIRLANIVGASLGAAVLVGCAAEVQVETGSGGQGGTGGQEPAPQSRCAQFTTKDGCCADDECLWLNARSSFPGRCFSLQENCSDPDYGTPCPESQFCLSPGDLLLSNAECQTNYGLGGSYFGVCVEDCPDEAETDVTVLAKLYCFAQDGHF
ncbi:MAG: hypothetical protein U0271_23235 [Polyangiaceae bacterium]